MCCSSICTAAWPSACWLSWRCSDYRNENDLYRAASEVAWEIWFTPQQTFKVEVTAQHSPLTSLNFAALRVKDAVADRFRAKRDGVRPSVETHHPDVRIHLHLTTDTATLYIDTSGEALFKRGWREDKGDAPLKETLAAAMIAATGWNPHGDHPQPLYDPCCGSGTVVIEAAQIARRIPAGILRRFAFEKLIPFQRHVWEGMLDEAEAQILDTSPVPIYGSDISHRMVDFAQRNAERAGVAGHHRAARRRCPATHAALRAARRVAAEPALWRAHCRRRQLWPQCRAAHGRGRTHGPRKRPDRRWRGIFQPTGQPLEEKLQRLERLDAHPRPEAARQNALQRIAPHAAVERPHRMPPVPL